MALCLTHDYCKFNKSFILQQRVIFGLKKYDISYLFTDAEISKNIS